MAEERVIAIKMTMDASGTVDSLNEVDQGVKKVDQSVNELNESAQELTMEEKLAQVNEKVQSGELDFRQLRRTIKEYQGIALAAGRTSPVGQEALQMAADLENQLTDLDNEVKRLADDGVALKGAMQIGTGVVAGFTAFKGVTAALGVENENLMKTMTQLQGAQAALMGLERIRAAFLEKESFAALLLSNIANKTKLLLTGELTVKTVLLTAAEKARTIATKAATIAQRVLNVVMAANPIGLIITAVGLLILNFNKLRDFTQKVIDRFGALNTILLLLLGPIGLLIIAFDQFFSTLEDEEEAAEKRLRIASENERKRHEERLKQIEKERDAKIAAADDTIKALELEKDTLEAEGKASDEATLKILEAELAKVTAVLEANAQKIQSWVTYYTNLAALRGQDEEEFKKSMAAQGIFLDELQQKANDLLEENERNVKFAENRITKFRREQREKDSADFKKHQQEQTKILEEEKKKQMEIEQKQLELLDKLRELRIQNIKNDDERELEQLKLKHERERDQLVKQFGENAELEKELLIKHEREMEALQKKINDKRIENEKKLNEMKRNQAKVNNDQIKGDAEETDAQVQEILAKIQLGLDFANQINDILDEIGKRRIEKLQAERDEDLSNLEEAKKKELSAENLSARQKALIEQKFAMQEFKIKKEAAEAEDKIAKRQFNRNKALKLADVAVNTAAAVVQALAAFPPPASFIVAGVTGAIGAAQAALIATQKFKGTAGSITPPSFNIPTEDGGAGAGGGAGAAGGGVQTDTGVSTAGLTDGPKEVVVSQVEINEQQNNLANVDDVATIG